MNDLAERLLDYGARIVKLVSALPPTLIGRTIGNQLLRSGTAVGANYEEARAGESNSDSIHKLQVALKELRESNYWLRLLVKAEVVPSSGSARWLTNRINSVPYSQKQWQRRKAHKKKSPRRKAWRTKSLLTFAF